MGEALVSFLLFFLAVICFFYLPGKLLTLRLKLALTSLESIFFATGSGFLLFTLIAYVLFWVRLDILFLPIMLVLSYLAIRTGKYLPSRIEKKHRKPLYIVLTLSFVFSLAMLVTGEFGDSIIYRRDDLWHLALINEMKAHFPPDNPGVAGVSLKGYHFFYNLVLAKISNAFFISPVSLHFRLFPLFTALMWGIGVYVVMFQWSKKISAALFAVFLTMFGGSFAFLLSFFGYTGFNWNNGLGMQQGAFTLYNPPLGISVVLILVALFSLFKYLTMREKNWLVPFILSVGLVSMFKVYAGMILIGATIGLAVIELVRRKYTLIWILLPIALLFLFTYWLFAGGSGYLIYFPLWAPHEVLRKFPGYGLDEKLYTYSSQGVLKGVLQVELSGLLLFIVGNIGTRLVGIVLASWALIKKRKKPSLFATFVLGATVLSIGIPLLFIQSGKVFEIIQMTQYFLFFCSLSAALGFSYLFGLQINKQLNTLILLVLLGATLPSAFETVRAYPNAHKSAQRLSSPYFQAMRYLREQGSYDDTVLQLPSAKTVLTEKELREWYKASDPSVVAFGNKRGFLNNQFIDFPGVDINPRIALMEKMFLFNSMSTSDSLYGDLKKEVLDGLGKYGVRYVHTTQSFPSFQQIGIKRVYQSGSHFIYKVGE